MEILIRKIQKDDYSYIFTLAKEMLKYQISPLRENVDMDYVRKNYIKDLRTVLYNMENFPEYEFLVALSGDNLRLGYLLLITKSFEATTNIQQAWIYDMAVEEEYWQSPVPEKLLKEAEAIAREKGLRHIGIRLDCSNKRAVDFFKSSCYDEERKKIYKKLPFEYKVKSEDCINVLPDIEAIKSKYKIFNTMIVKNYNRE